MYWLFPLLLATGCIFPPSLGVEKQDAGQNSPPSILTVRSDLEELPEPGPVVFDIGMTAGSMNFELLDTDGDDTLYVRIFVDYNNPIETPPRSTCTARELEGAKRTATCDLRGLCTMAELNQVPDPYMTIIVFDREPLESGAPTYQAMPPEGLSTSRGYFLKCRAGAPT
ncbi:MAG: hypothetical protein H0T79_06815 [Deltaproteobacteria bacterium]|nr:hypothetical protein [Deltaproteobacteria bacterium]